MHPIVDQMLPSPEQTPAIRERGRDVVVTAGAGTGKTRTLVARYLALVAEGLPLRSIVAITFTRKAAREMRNRVREEVRLYLVRPDLAETERGRWQSLYAELDAARIGTIHSLCSEILRAHPAEAGVDPRFEVLEEGRGNILLGQVVDGALAWAADQEEAMGLFSLLGEGALRDTLVTMLSKRLEVEACWASRRASLWPVWEDRILTPIRTFVDDAGIRADFEELLTVRQDGTLAQAEAAGDKLAAPLLRLLSGWEQVAAYRAAGDWAAIATCLPALRRDMPPVGQAKNGGSTTRGRSSPSCGRGTTRRSRIGWEQGSTWRWKNSWPERWSPYSPCLRTQRPPTNGSRGSARRWTMTIWNRARWRSWRTNRRCAPAGRTRFERCWWTNFKIPTRDSATW